MGFKVLEEWLEPRFNDHLVGGDDDIIFHVYLRRAKELVENRHRRASNQREQDDFRLQILLSLAHRIVDVFFDHGANDVINPLRVESAERVHEGQTVLALLVHTLVLNEGLREGFWFVLEHLLDDLPGHQVLDDEALEHVLEALAKELDVVRALDKGFEIVQGKHRHVVGLY